MAAARLANGPVTYSVTEKGDMVISVHCERGDVEGGVGGGKKGEGKEGEGKKGEGN